ncbi:hypothetical protein Pmani_019663 [Petrolisthes manimaculis]|uniref:Lambda-crystallin n=1 Tax=Petrolisthes manimaculis TaxID=1843537 RepID=A0AAE1PJ57_9EUCA|nr:hypothetical protein Pmani_032892 [Petrolisthes manimaculis]KAK4308651.1 hypothetical protein Pmani_019663 [Petrolisthes manimaculis]
MAKREKIGIVGSGFIGRSWAMLFASVGYEVCLYDIKQEQVPDAINEIKKQLHELESSNLLRGNISVAEQIKCIRGVTNLKDCVVGSKHVQECVFEDVDLKKEVFKKLDELVGPNTVLSSSTSCIIPSLISPDLVHKENFIVSHPINPPYHVPLVEIVPAPWTRKDVVARTRALMAEIGQSPVVFTREHPGFGVNRLQYAILNECNHLVRSGVVTAEDVDTIMKDGLGMRYAWMGPLETALLNANGMKDYLERYADTIKNISETLEGKASWDYKDCGDLVSQLDEMVPLDKLQNRREWRDKRLAALGKLKRDAKEWNDAAK